MPRRTTYRDMLSRGSRSKTTLTQSNSNRNLSRRNSTHRNERDDATKSRDEEISSLRERLARYENNPSKNENTPRGGGAPPTTSETPKNQEILNFIAQTMRSLEDYKKLLTN
jgi:hypothetical protein